MTIQTERRQLYRPKPRPLEVVVTEGDPLLQISIYEQATLITRRKGARWTQYAVSPDALAQVLAGTPIASGLLPPHTLGTGRVHGEPFYVLYIPPSVRRLQMEAERYTIPLPPLIWAGCGTDYRIWALDAAEQPERASAPLFVAPFPNCYRSGAVCWGSSEARPVASPGTLLKVLKLFLEESYFNLHLANDKSLKYRASVVARWAQLVKSKAEAYPLDDLLPAGAQLASVLAGQPWGDGHHE